RNHQLFPTQFSHRVGGMAAVLAGRSNVQPPGDIATVHQSSHTRHACPMHSAVKNTTVLFSESIFGNRNSHMSNSIKVEIFITHLY
ncbi:hypothetical protein L9F63_027594, partial [Diploptera punctata]